MDCSEARKLLHAYLDNELDLRESAALEQHLSECPECAKLYEEQTALRQAIAGLGTEDPLPPALRRRVRTAVRGEAKSRYPLPAWRWVGAAATFAAALLLLVLATRNAFLPSAGDRLTDELIQSHIRSLMLNHLTDVTSSDQHTVKPWFNGKIDFSPDVKDFASEGYPLIGGRLDYVNGNAAAVLVYHRRGHIINLFIIRSGKIFLPTVSRQGYNILSWEKEDALFCAVSDLNQVELESFEALLRR